MKKHLVPFVAAMLVVVLSSGLADTGRQSSSVGDQTLISTGVGTNADQSNNNPQPIISSATAINGNWAPLANYPAGAASGIANFWWPDSGKAFLAGGSPAAAIPNCYFYNPVTNTYTAKTSLPTGRAYGKMVRVRQSLYYVGAIGAVFTTPDGALYQYNPATDIWTTKAATPAPVIQEMAVCVWNDSLIITVGGSTTGFTGGVNSVRVYNPFTDTWTILAGTFPAAAMGLAAECIGNEIVVIGGVAAGPAIANIAYRGTVVPGSPISITWRTTTNPYGEGVYRASSALWSGHMLFGPTQKAASPPSGKLNGIKIADSTIANFLPDMPAPTLGNIPNMSVRITADSVYLYMFGGYNGTAAVANSNRYAFANPTPAGPDTLLLILQDTTTASVKRHADHDTLFTYLSSLVPTYKRVYIDTAGAALPSLTNYKRILYVETSFDNPGTRWLGANSRQALKNWLNSGTPGNKKSLVMVGGDLAYNLSRTGSGARDTVLAKDMLKFSFKTDNGNVTGQNSITGVNINNGGILTLNTAPAGTGFYPDGCFPEAGGSVLYRYTGRGATDTVASVGYAASGYTAATLFADPRYFTVSGPNTGFRKALQDMLAFSGAITEVPSQSLELPSEYTLSQNYPNPFNPTTTIQFGLPVAANVTVKIYNVLGQEVATLVDGLRNSGTFQTVWNGRNSAGSPVASGMYFYSLVAKSADSKATFTNIKKMLLLK